MRSGGLPAPGGRRIDQWLWFARFVKTRSLAARLCAAGTVTLNGVPIRKANQQIRVGDTIAVPQGPFRRTVRVSALGVRRGPAPEARLLYEEAASPAYRFQSDAPWVPLLAEDDPLGESR